MKLSIICNPVEFTGHGIHSCQVIRRLPALLGCEMIVRPQRPGNIPDDIAKLVQSGENDAEFEIILGPPRVSPTHGKRTIYMATCESTRLRRDEVAFLNMAEIVVTPSNWCASVMSANGVTKPIHVVPLGFSQEFAYTGGWKRDMFTFSCAGQLSNGRTRKGVGRVVDLFLQEFQEKDVRLLVKLGPGETIRVADGVEVTNAIMSERDCSMWMRQSHCFINLATGGFELWLLQAMAMGLPVISHCFGGVSDFFNPGLGLSVNHHLVPAGDSWAGLWAEADGDAVRKAMRFAYGNYHAVKSIGWDAADSVEHLTWENSIKKLANILRPLMEPKPVVIESPAPIDERLTVCITSFKRAKYLERAIKSCVEAGIEHIVIASMDPDPETQQVLYRAASYHGAKIVPLQTDLGCNELWLQAAYRAETDRILILHDDDYLDPKFGKVYQEKLSLAMSAGYLVTWRARNKWDSGQWAAADYIDGVSGIMPMGALHQILLDPVRLSLSPIVTIFRKQSLIRALKECAENLTRPESFWGPEMLLGTEIVAHYRNSQAAKEWFYCDEVLAYYGTHDESGTMKALKIKQTAELHRGYNIARDYCRNNPKPRKVQPRIIFVYSDYSASSPEEDRRNSYALSTWLPHFESGEVLPISAPDGRALDRMPFVKDLFDAGAKIAQPEDIIVYANRDICLTQNAAEKIRNAVADSNGICLAVRRNIYKPLQPGKIYKTVLNCYADTGFDLIAVTPQWWKSHREKIPDMLIGREAWDAVFRWMAHEEGGKFLMDDVTYHEFHESQWIKERTTNAGQIHNRRLAREYFSKRLNHSDPILSNAAKHIMWLLNDETWKEKQKL